MSLKEVTVLTKVLVVYQSKWGNTKIVAEKIVEGLNQAPGIETIISALKEIETDRIVGSDAILIGSPNHIGRATGGVKKFISQLGKLHLKAKGIAFFDTYLGKDYKKAVKKMEKQADETLKGIELLAPGLSIRVEGMKGPIAGGELQKCADFAAKIVAKTIL